MKNETMFAVIGPVDGNASDPTKPFVPNRYMVRITYGVNGGATLRSYFSGDKMGRATGGGYDITAESLIDMVCKRWPTVPRVDGAMGINAVTDHCRTHGVLILSMADLLYRCGRP